MTTNNEESFKEKILIVDDNQQNRAMMLAVLKKDNREVFLAESGVRALDMLNSMSFSLIILDVQMPGLGGFETLGLMKQSGLDERTPIVFITSHSKDAINIDAGFGLGAHDYLFRPIDINLLKNKIDAILKYQRRQQELTRVNESLEDILASELQKKRSSIETYFTEEAFENNINGLIVVDKNLNYIRVNKAFARMTGYTADELLGKTPSILKSGLQSDEFYKDMWETLKSSGAWQGELWNRNKNNELYAEWLTINAIKDGDGTVSHYIGVASDITGHKQFQKKLEQNAGFDYLTGLPNRRSFLKALNKNIGGNPEKKVIGVFFMDLNKFKPINDNFGHKAGDELLAAVAKRLQKCVRQCDVVARIGGDEFIIMVNADEQGFTGVAKTIAEKVIMALTSPFNISNYEIRIGTSIGIAFYPYDGGDAETLIAHADTAMYRAKKQESGHYCFFNRDLEG